MQVYKYKFMWVVFVSNYGKHDCACCKCDCGLHTKMRKMTTAMMSAPKPSLKRLSEDKNISWHRDVLFSSASRYSTAWPFVSLSPPRLNCCYSKPEVLWFPPCMHNLKCHFLFSETPTSEMYKNSVCLTSWAEGCGNFATLSGLRCFHPVPINTIGLSDAALFLF